MFQYKFLHFNITLHLFYKRVQCIYCVFGYIVCTLCSHSGELSACCCTAAQQKESTYPACLQEKLVGGKQLIWVPEDPGENKESVLMGGLFFQKNECSLLFFCTYGPVALNCFQHILSQ